jgi:hypothetical protein
MKKHLNRLMGILGYQITKKISNSSNFQFPIESTQEDQQIINFCSRFSMTGELRMWHLLKSMQYINSANIEGDLVECGVWRGGNLMLMNLAMKEKSFSRKILGYDTFTGMTEPSAQDIDFSGQNVLVELKENCRDESIQNIHAYASLAQVTSNLKLVDKYCDLELIEGAVEITLKDPANIPDKIALLRLDTDWYESTLIELEKLFPKLSRGGVLIIDDYGHYTGAKKAFDEYFGKCKYYVHYVDYSCRILLKN